MISDLRRVLTPRTAQVALLLVLTVAAVMLANAEAGNQVADDAEVALAAEEVIRSAAIVYSEANDTILLAQAQELDMVGVEVVDSALDALTVGRAALGESVGRLVGVVDEDVGLVEALGPFDDQTGDIASAVEAGDSAAALSAGDQLAVSYESLVTAASRARAEYQGRIDAVREGLGSVAVAARFVVAMVIPAVALLFLYSGLRRRQREALIMAELSREKVLRKKKDQFLAGASHHINTPMSVVLGFAEMLRDNGRDYNAAVRTEMIELMAIQAAEASHVVEDILIAGRDDLGELTLQETSIDVRSILERVTRDWSTEHRARLGVTGNGVATGDEKRVSQVLRNILRNAVGHGGSNVTVEISQLFNKVLVEVSDDGRGIPEGQEEKVFQTYYTQHHVDGVPPSLGLGLSVSRRLARAMGGDVRYRRDDGVTAFEFSLPRSYEVAAEELPDVEIDPTRGEPNGADITEIVRFGGPRVVFQPIVDMRKFASGDDCIVGYEALSRFPFGDPPTWFRAAKATGTHLDLELACIAAAIDQFASARPEHFLAVNLSDAVLVSSRLNDALTGINPGRLVLELSEQSSVSSYEVTSRVMGVLAERGVRLAIDDVGASEIDLWHVIRLSASIVKIDMSLVRDVNQSAVARGVVRSLVSLAAELGVMVVAEGVETDSEHQRLVDLGVEFGQGYLYGKPDAFELRTAAVGQVSDAV